MAQIFVAAYLVISLPVALLLWTVLAVAKRGAPESPESETPRNDRFFKRKAESINFHSS